jgi:predicted RNase H-like nuclease
MNYVNPQISTIVFGFDSAWTDAPKTPGAICAIAFDERGRVEFHEPRLVSFTRARAFVDVLRREFALSLVALDQPTVVPNSTGSRPVEKVAGSLVSFVGGGVQPANRGKIGMFCDSSPVWSFLSELNATQDPINARTASAGHFLIEVFPALALPSFKDDFSRRLGAPKYNPQNHKKFRLEDWRSVTRIVQTTAHVFKVSGLVDWSASMHALTQPCKADQDKLDAALCALIGLAWRAGPVSCSAMLGDLTSGYMVTPLSDITRPRLEQAAIRRGVLIA